MDPGDKQTMKSETGKIPVIIGVTGHRNLRDRDYDDLKNSVRTEFESLRAKYPHSGFAVMTCLAEGADQLCAETALELGFEIITVLPMSADEYSEDFEGDALRRLKELTEKSSKVLIAPHKEPFREDRDYLYRQAGIYIAEHCHILFAERRRSFRLSSVTWPGELQVSSFAEHTVPLFR